MAHLGADVAAFVDGQLEPAAMQHAREHLEVCESCRHDVRQQRLLKSRMGSVAAPVPPPTLLASLSGLAAAPPPPEPWWHRVLRSAVVRGGVGLVGASVVVVAAAYALGGAEDRIGDEVVPPFERFVTAFDGHGAASGTAVSISSSSAISEPVMKQLDASGWPCHQHLAGGFHREGGQWWDHREVVVLSYSDGFSRLQLFEQNGVLDRDALAGFDEADWDGARVWVRDGDPMILTWDAAGVVYTVLTDADLRRLGAVVAQLPTSEPQAGTVDRVRAGLDRMASWVRAA